MNPKERRAKQRRRRLQSAEQLVAKALPLSTLNSPKQGWIRKIRDALGMSARQLGERAHLSQAAVAEIERRERDNAVTLRTMAKLAAAMDCEFVYAFIPRQPLSELIRAQSHIAAAQLLEATKERVRAPKERRRAQELASNIDRKIWEARIPSPRSFRRKTKLQILESLGDQSLTSS